IAADMPAPPNGISKTSTACRHECIAPNQAACICCSVTIRDCATHRASLRTASIPAAKAATSSGGLRTLRRAVAESRRRSRLSVDGAPAACPHRHHRRHRHRLSHVTTTLAASAASCVLWLSHHLAKRAECCSGVRAEWAKQYTRGKSLCTWPLICCARRQCAVAGKQTRARWNQQSVTDCVRAVQQHERRNKNQAGGHTAQAVGADGFR